MWTLANRSVLAVIIIQGYDLGFLRMYAMTTSARLHGTAVYKSSCSMASRTSEGDSASIRDLELLLLVSHLRRDGALMNTCIQPPGYV